MIDILECIGEVTELKRVDVFTLRAGKEINFFFIDSIIMIVNEVTSDTSILFTYVPSTDLLDRGTLVSYLQWILTIGVVSVILVTVLR